MSLYPRINGRKTDILAYISSKILLAHLSLLWWRRQNGVWSLPARDGKIPDQVGNDGENRNDMRRSGMTTDKLKIDN
jgi:hypothetical protein